MYELRIVRDTSAWMSPKDLEPLTTKDIETFLAKPGSKGGQLRTGYQIALDPTDWFEEQADLAMAREVKNATEENDQLASGDEMDYEGEDGGSSKKASNKRKRQSDAGESKTKESAADAKKRKAAEAGEPSTKKRVRGCITLARASVCSHSLIPTTVLTDLWIVKVQVESESESL